MEISPISPFQRRPRLVDELASHGRLRPAARRHGGGLAHAAHAFAEFISAFLSKYGRWNSPKFLFGESSGTPRAAVLVNLLQRGYSIDLNGVIMLSQILNFDLFIDGPENNPGVDVAYMVALPTYAATAWYHHKLPASDPPRDLEPFLHEVESFAMGDYARGTLNYGKDKTYRPIARLFRQWAMKHSQPGSDRPPFQAPNTMPDLARAMKTNPGLKVLPTGGYFDLATPFNQGWYEMHHLTIPAELQRNIEYRYYPSGHMVYAHQESHAALHKDVADFIETTASHSRR